MHIVICRIRSFADLHDEDGYYTIDFDDLAKKEADETQTTCVSCAIL
ncbi:MAG: hypothetical protein V8R61_08690 [Enterocloster sp.]